MASKHQLGTLIVTGASRGIGAAIATLAAERGYAVAVNFLTGEAEANNVVANIVDAGGRAIAVHADIAHEHEIIRMFETAERELGPIQALVNNAGITGGFARVEDVSGAAIASLFAVNVAGAILCSREAVRRMSTRRGGAGGAIVNISSRAAHTGSPGEWVHYAASKGALDSFTTGLAREVATEGIRVNAVAPGLSTPNYTPQTVTPAACSGSWEPSQWEGRALHARSPKVCYGYCPQPRRTRPERSCKSGAAGKPRRIATRAISWFPSPSANNF